MTATWFPTRQKNICFISLKMILFSTVQLPNQDKRCHLIFPVPVVTRLVIALISWIFAVLRIVNFKLFEPEKSFYYFVLVWNLQQFWKYLLVKINEFFSNLNFFCTKISHGFVIHSLLTMQLIKYEFHWKQKSAVT